MNELTGSELDAEVARCLGHKIVEHFGSYIKIGLPEKAQSSFNLTFSPTTDWIIGGKLIEQEHIHLIYTNIKGTPWSARINANLKHTVPVWYERRGITPLEAAMRVYVAYKQRKSNE